jgi:hypothetical protein
MPEQQRTSSKQHFPKNCNVIIGETGRFQNNIMISTHKATSEGMILLLHFK